MYVTRQELTVTAGQGTAYLERSKRIGALQKSQEGFVERLVMNSFGYPGRYAILTTWKSREAARAYALSPEQSAFLKENPLAGIGTQNRPMEAYQTIHEFNASSDQPGSVTLIDWALDNRPGNAAAFEASRKEMFELVTKHRNQSLSGQLLRFLGGLNRYLVVRQYDSREPIPAAAPPEVQAFNAAHPATEFASTPNVQERYEVIQRI